MIRRVRKVEDPLSNPIFSRSYLLLNREFISIYGLESAVFLSNLIEKYKYFKDRNMLRPNGSFFLTFEQQADQIGLTTHKLRACKKILISDGIIQIFKYGMPSKEFYKLDLQRLLYRMYNPSPNNYVFDNGGQDLGSGEVIKNKYILYPPLLTVEAIDRKKIPPNLEWVESYCKSRKNAVDPKRFIDFYTMKNWKVGKVKMVDWQAAVRTWERSENGFVNTKPNLSYKKPYIIDDGMKYRLCEDGEYRNKAGDTYIE